MSQSTVETQLAKFATTLVESAGGIMDWQSEGSEAMAIVPEELAQSLGQHNDAFAVRLHHSDNRLTTDDGLVLSLGGEFIDLAGRTLHHFIPAVGSFAPEDFSLKKTEFASVIESAFGWQNARARVLEARVVRVPYHVWWFHVTLHSEETWEALVPATLNSHTLLRVPLDDLLQMVGLKPVKGDAFMSSNRMATLESAMRIVEAQTMLTAAPFLQRIDARRERDRKRLKDYYQAMLKETSTSSKRASPMTKAELDAKKKAVSLELQRKLSELDERYLVDAELRPVVLAESYIPAAAIDLEIQRKSQKRVFRLYWNSLLKQMEPFACSHCQRASWNFWFTNDTVQPLCNSCHDCL